jgi:excisionase family DNA binding protein
MNHRNKTMPSQLHIAIKAVELYAATHPRPAHVTQRQAAEMLNVSVATVNRLIKSRAIKVNRLGRIPVAQVDQLLEPVDHNLPAMSSADSR